MGSLLDHDAARNANSARVVNYETGPHYLGYRSGLAGRVAAGLLLAGMLGASAAAQQATQPLSPPAPPPASPTAPAPVERVGPEMLRVGNVLVDMGRKEVSVRGTVNDVMNLEFLANTKGGFKAYESALELDTSAINFNVGLILIGLDFTRSMPPARKFDPEPPQGDPVDIFVEWDVQGETRRVRAEQLIYDLKTEQTLSEGPWVYTGSVFIASNNAYLADLDGALIGFMRDPSPVIDSARPLGNFGSHRINPNLGLAPGTPVLLTVRALPRP